MPSNLPPAVAAYLQRFRTWAREELDKKVTQDVVAPYVLLAPHDVKRPNQAFMIRVDSTGALTAVPAPLGQGKP
jgi:hypothetical protein